LALPPLRLVLRSSWLSKIEVFSGGRESSLGESFKL
jgi:hypothetical protein